MKPYFKITFALSIIAIIFIARLAYLQLLTDRYALNAANTSIKTEYIIPQRGVIFDRHGKILVGNQPSFEISITTALLKPDFDTLSFCRLVNISKENFIQKVDEIKQDRYFSKLTPMTFMKDLSREDIARIQERIFKYPAFNIISRPQRKYEVTTSGNLLGYTNQVSDAYIKRDSLYYKPGDIAGITGVERSYEDSLRGKKGIKYIQKDIRLRNIGSYKDGKLDKQVVPGKDLTLTIDYDLQRTAEEMLVGKHGAIVALDPNSGEILVLATGPDVNPQLYSGPEKTKNIYKLQMDTLYENKPTFDRSIQAAYPPGSTFKLLTALAGMQMGVMDDKTVFPCGRGFNYRGLRIRGHGGADPLIPAIRVSSNCYFSYAFIAIMNKYPGDPTRGVNEWRDIMNSFGVGVFLNNDLAVGSKGHIPSGEFYEKRSKKKNWISDITRNGSILNGMGQGDVLLTPLQMANFVAAIVNRGWFYTPHIVKSIGGQPNPDPRFKVKHKTLVDPKYFEPVIKGMEQVVLAGTARRLMSKDFTQLAKTGTAQVPQGKDNSIFVLAAPADKPKIVVAAVMEHAGFGATWAGPAATVIAEKYITGELKRTHLYEKMIKSSFMPEYKRQWVADLKRKGLWETSLMKKQQDSIKATKLKIKLEKQKDSIDKLKKN
ncbi:penicillin-binding protein 2 [Elizabethkingia sp. JS20170427COW]|uniref:peptidoglycan D,D-transpeptidase FtsI family protein n=1 Tax=Elizabethkingia sp. JS20170427COW TaxID=2583851 RepID=UPI00111045F2|nr:penicillin-binding transpeptidase domain-containing protein [Elizabethkingia sp. JS20170427COW]QCX53051.1 peptidoglycan glycosyltransferase [Elizabethkingia sp. JS20170427COW]